MLKAKQGTTQGRLDSFFSVVSTSSTKRKVGWSGQAWEGEAGVLLIMNDCFEVIKKRRNSSIQSNINLGKGRIQKNTVESLVFMGINVRKFITLTHEFISHKLIIKMNWYNNVINHTSPAFFFYPLVLVPVPIQLAKIASNKTKKTKNMFNSYFHKFRLPYFESILNLRVFGDNFLNSESIFLLQTCLPLRIVRIFYGFGLKTTHYGLIKKILRKSVIYDESDLIISGTFL